MTQFLHPSVDTKIVDNSAVFQTADGTTTLFQVIRSPQGPDNVLTRVTSESEFLFLFGKPNLSKYGQASYNVLSWLRSGGLAYVIRIMPTTSTFSTTGLYADLKTTATDEKLISLHTYNETTAASLSSIKSILTDTLVYTDNKSDATIPLGIMYPRGRGDGYSDLGFRVGLKDDMDGTYAFRTYTITITSKDAAGSNQDLEGPFTVAFDPEAVDAGNQSLYWVNIINKYSQYVSVIDYRDGFDKITAYLLDETVEPDFNPAGLDIIFGISREETEALVYEPITWVNEANAADTELSYVLPDNTFFKPNGVNKFGVGVVGSWSGPDSTEALTVNAYNGITDGTIRDRQLVEIDIMLDANYPVSVKNAMGDLAVDRDDCMALLDLNIQANEQQTLDHRKDAVSYAHRNVAVFAHDMEVYDSLNGENIRVTSPYLLARKIPETDIANGIQYTFVGPRRGIITGYENINFIPNPVWRETFYKARINYIERDPRKTNFATQSTSQIQNSALSDINNVRVILAIKREVNAMMADYRMEFNDTGTYDSMSYDLNNYLEKWLSNRACSTISGSVFASDYDRQQKLARVAIELTFTGIIERIAVQIVVNR